MDYSIFGHKKRKVHRHSLSEEELGNLKAELKKAEPYPPDHPSLNTLDYTGEVDFDRTRATFAKLILDMYYEEKHWEKDY